jgi:hypothetical protein
MNDNELVSMNGAPPPNVLSNFLGVSPGWIGTMKIALLDGRDLQAEDARIHAVLVNRAFARQYFGGRDPVGQWFTTMGLNGTHDRHEIVGWVEDVVSKNVHDPMSPAVYLPLHTDALGSSWNGTTLVIRTSIPDPSTLTASLRQMVERSEPELRAQTIRERLLASLATFFATVALLLAAVGLYGVLSYSVLQREREIGVRIALGAQLGHVARLVTARVVVMVGVGGLAGWSLGLLAVRYVQSLLYGVKGGDPVMLAATALVLLMAVALSALPAVIKAARIDPATMLRAE